MKDAAHSQCSINVSQCYSRETPKHPMRNPSIAWRFLGPCESAPSFLASATTLLETVLSPHCHVTSVHKYLNNVSSDYYNI